jgi:hypothetical protein
MPIMDMENAQVTILRLESQLASCTSSQVAVLQSGPLEAYS